MKINYEEVDQICVVTLQGDLTHESTEQLLRQSRQRVGDKTRDIVIDMSSVEFVDSIGLETLLEIQECCEEQLGQLRLAGASENIDQILRVTHLASRLICTESIEEACASLSH